MDEGRMLEPVENETPVSDAQQEPTLMPAPATATPLRTRSKNNKPTNNKAVVRDLDTLHNLKPAQMSETEMRKYIEALREGINQLSAQNEQYRRNSQSAFEKANLMESKYQDLKLKAAAKINFSKQQISTAYAAIMLLTNIEE